MCIRDRTGIVFEVAASGVFGNKKEVDDTPFWDVLLYLYKCKFEYLHQKQMCIRDR